MPGVEEIDFGLDAQDGPRVTETPLVGELRLPAAGSARVNMKDVLWFTPHPPPIESAEIPGDPMDEGERPSVVPVALPSRGSRALSPAGVSRWWASVNPALALGLLGALAATVYFSQPNRHGSAIAQLALAFPDRMVIDMSEAPMLVTVDDLPVAEEPDVLEVRAVERPLRGGPVRTARSPERGIPKSSLSSVAAQVSAPEEAGHEPPLSAFRASDALSAMQAAAKGARGCLSGETDVVAARVAVTFASTGRVTQAVIDGGPLAGTQKGGCVARAFRSARMDPFSGPPATVRRTMVLR